MQSLLEHFRAGGWAMLFIFAFGILAVGASLRFAWRGDHRLTGFARWMTLTTSVMGAFGFSTGMINVCNYVVYRSKPDERWLNLVEGLGEALNCLSAGLMFTALACLLVAVGHRRFPVES